MYRVRALPGPFFLRIFTVCFSMILLQYPLISMSIEYFYYTPEEISIQDEEKEFSPPAISRMVDLRNSSEEHISFIAEMIAATYAYASSGSDVYYRTPEEQLRYLMANPQVLELCSFEESPCQRYNGMAPDTVVPHFVSEEPLAVQQLGMPTLVRGKPYVRLASMGVHPQLVGTEHHGKAVLDLQLEVLRQLGEEFNLLSIFPAHRRAEIQHFGQAGYQPVTDLFLADQILQFHGSVGHGLAQRPEGVVVSRQGKPYQEVLLVRPAGPFNNLH